MTKNKLCCRIYPLVLILISALLSVGIRYFSNGAYELQFLKDSDEFFNLLGTTFAIAFLPIGLFYYLTGRDKYQHKARQLALLGFVPVIVLLAFLAFR